MLVRPDHAANCIVNAKHSIVHRDDGKRFFVRADEILSAFVELESAIQSQKTEYGELHACRD